ncbi:MAG: maltotransferase domain-containing protein, partial [Gemmatimonadota bacterium]
MATAEEKGSRDRRRIVVEGVQPEVDAGRFACKRTTGEELVVEADIFTDGHEALAARLLWRHERDRRWRVDPMELLGNDRWRASFPIEKLGAYRYTIEAWLDPWGGWRRDMGKRLAAYQDVRVDLIIGARLLEDTARRAGGRDAKMLAAAARVLEDGATDITERIRRAMDDELDAIAVRYPDLRRATRYERELACIADPPRARFSAWYELFPRSASPIRSAWPRVRSQYSANT